MSFEFRLPDIGEGVAEGEVVQWFVQEGGTVQEDAPLVSVLTDKANVEIPSPKSGRIVKLHAQVGEKVKVGGLLVTIDAAGSPSSPTPPAPAPKQAAPAPPPSKAGAAASSAAKAATASAPAAAAGGAASGSALASPYVRRLATERGIDLSRIAGTGPGGRIVEADLASSVGSASAASPPPPVNAAGSSAPPPGDGVLERIPIRGLRRVISEHMSDAVHKAAHFTYVEEIDASELVKLRERMAKHIEKDGLRLSYLPFLIKAVVAGLKSHPHLNATMDDARNELVVRSEYNIGLALAGPDGLLVPVLHHAGNKSIKEMAREIQELSEKGKAGKLDRASLSGSTFTITSLGALGGVLATPILNYPEVAILGVHKIQRRPVYKPDGSVGPADLMNLSISLDHRVIDGYEGAQFLATVKAYLEDPHQLFAELR